MVETGWNLPPPPGFRGLDPDKPIDIYVRHLPHWRQEGATYVVTFRLADSLPQSKLRELSAIRAMWERQHPPPRSDDDLDALVRETMQRVEDWLDQGFGSCVLKDAALAACVAQSMLHFAGDRYELGCCVVMPNHAHAVVRPLNPGADALERVLQSWKRHSSYEIHERLGQTGALWQEESFDRIIRDDEHLYRAIQYIGRNPAKAGLRNGEFVLWLNPEWARLGWTFDP